METQAYFEDIQLYILKELHKAKTSILVAVAWFTDKELYDVLCLKASDGVRVEVLLTNDSIRDIKKTAWDFWVGLQRATSHSRHVSEGCDNLSVSIKMGESLYKGGKIDFS